MADSNLKKIRAAYYAAGRCAACGGDSLLSWEEGREEFENFEDGRGERPSHCTELIFAPLPAVIYELRPQSY